MYAEEVGKVAVSYTGRVHEVVSALAFELGALRNLLLRKGLITEEDWDGAIKEAEAGVMVRSALNPRLQALQGELRRLASREGGEEG